MITFGFEFLSTYIAHQVSVKAQNYVGLESRHCDFEFWKNLSKNYGTETMLAPLSLFFLNKSSNQQLLSSSSLGCLFYHPSYL